MYNPYADKPDYQFWRRSVSGRGPRQVDPIVHTSFGIGRKDAVATAGSCFAQHIARTLTASGFNYFLGEDKPATPYAENENFGTFSARYGNVYTVRQLWQLFRRAYGLFEPADIAWRRQDSRWIDPFRPRIQAGGFASIEDLVAEREAHFEAVRRVFEECDIFIFTLGLTEGWIAKKDNAVFPLAPGAVVADGDPEAYAFHNFTVGEMEEDLSRFLHGLRRVNPNCKVLLTVSPVALIATFEDTHVLSATIYSKSALRVVAETATRKFPSVAYFPSYEMITGPHARSAFFEDDLREIRPEGVAYVMSVFAAHYLNQGVAAPSPAPSDAPVSEAAVAQAAEAILNLQHVICDEEKVEQSP